MFSNKTAFVQKIKFFIYIKARIKDFRDNYINLKLLQLKLFCNNYLKIK